MLIRGQAVARGTASPPFTPYRWQKQPEWVPENVEFRDSPSLQGAVATIVAEKTARLAEFTRLRENGETVADAGDHVGVTLRTARDYERLRLGLEAKR